MFRRRVLLIFAALVGGAVSPIAAQVTRNYVFPPVGLGASETASITVVNAAPVAQPGMPAPSCTGTIWFFNSNGAVGVATPFTVGSEQFMTVSLPFAKAGLSGNRGEIHGKVSITGPIGPAFCALTTTMETYDSTSGVTHAVLTPGKGMPDPGFPIVVLDPLP